MSQLSLKECENLLDKYGVNLIRTIYIENKSDLIKATKYLNYPLIIKAFSPEIIHKAKNNLVIKDIIDEGELNEAYNTILSTIKKLKLKSYSIAVQNQMSGDEYIIGAKVDPVFGYAVIFGLGGIHTNILNKFSIKIGDINDNDLNNMISETAGKILLDEKINKKIKDIISKVSKLSKNEKISEMDLNPIMINERGVHVVDVRIIK